MKTNLDVIKNLSKKELANLLVYSKTVEDWDYDYEDNLCYYGSYEEFYHPFSQYCFSDFDDALNDCIEVLDKPFTGFNKYYD